MAFARIPFRTEARSRRRGLGDGDGHGYGSKEEEVLKYFIRELLLLSILVFEKFTLQTEECLVATIL